MGHIDLFCRVQEMLDSPLRDEFIRRFRIMYKNYHDPNWVDEKEQFKAEGYVDDASVERVIDLRPLINQRFDEGYHQTNEGTGKFGSIGFEFKEGIDVKKKSDLIDDLVEDIKEVGAFYLVTYAEAPERIVKKAIHDKFAIYIVDGLELLLGPVVDSITGREEFSCSTDVHSKHDVKVSEGRKKRRQQIIKRDISILERRIKKPEIQNDPILLRETKFKLEKLKGENTNWKKVFDTFVRLPIRNLLDW